MFKRAAPSLSLIAILLSNTAYALDLDAQLNAGAEHTDNVLLSPDNKQSDTELNAEFAFRAVEETKNLQADVGYSFSHTEYVQDTLSDENTIEGLADINWTIVQDAFDWRFSANTQNLRRSRQEADIIANRETRNILSTGPAFQARLGSVDSLILSGLYTDTSFEDTDSSDNSRITANLMWLHRLPRSRSLVAGVSYIDTNFDDELLPDIETRQSYLGYSSTISSAEWSVKLGYNESERDFSEKVEGPLFEAKLSYLSSHLEASLIALNLITDSATGLGANPNTITGDLTPGDSNFGQVDIVERSYVDTSLTTRALCASCSLIARLTYDDQDFDELDLDEVSIAAQLIFRYRITRLLTTELNLGHQAIDFDANDREDTVSSAALRLSYSIFENLNAYISLGHEKRASNLDNFDYQENRAGAGLRYSF